MKKIALYILLFSSALPLFKPDLALGQMQTDSNEWSTRVGDPPENIGGSTTQMGQAAQDLVTAFAQNCNGDPITQITYGISSSTYRCMEGNMPATMPFPDAGFLEIMISATNYTYYQCVGFIETVAAGVTGQRIPGGNARDFAGTNPPGYRWVPNGPDIQSGDIVVYTYGQFGHIATVTRVIDINAGVFEIGESNFDLQGSVRRSIVNRADPRIAGWLRRVL